MLRIALLTVVLLAATPATAADIQKCAAADGGITYQDSPCRDGKTIGTLPRAPAYADPAALRLAESERLRLERAQESRARLALLDASREAIARGAAAPLELPAPDPGLVVPYDTPYYYAVPSYPGVVSPSRRGSRGPVVSGTMASPGILDTPAPCNTLQCREQRAARARR